MTSNKEEQNAMSDKGGRITKTENSNVLDISKADDISKDILDITDTPDVAVWNKSVQIKSNDANMVKHSKERENGEVQTIGIGLRKKRRKDNDDNKGLKLNNNRPS